MSNRGETMNLIEKYFAKAAGLDKIAVGQDIRCNVDLVAGHDVTGPMAIEQFKEIGVDRVFDPDKVVMVVDHIYPAATVQARKMHLVLSDFARDYGVKLYDRGQGVIHQLLWEKHTLQPGSILVAADSHTCTAGGYGALGIGVGSTELAVAMATGTIDLEVPEVVQVYMKGKLASNTYGKDIVLSLARRFGADGLTDKVLLLTGPGIEELSTEERMTVCNMGIEMGTLSTCFGTIEKERETAQTIEVDMSEIVPAVACPFSPAEVKDVQEVQGLKVSQVVVGSCTNGRLNDMENVVKILKKHKVHPEVNMLIIPASKHILDQMEKRGWCKIIRNAGAVITNPGCGPCFGAHQGLVTENDIVVSTTNRNFPGRMGSLNAQIYLASPATAAETAVQGKITVPGTLAFAEVI